MRMAISAAATQLQELCRAMTAMRASRGSRGRDPR